MSDTFASFLFKDESTPKLRQGDELDEDRNVGKLFPKEVLLTLSNLAYDGNSHFNESLWISLIVNSTQKDAEKNLLTWGRVQT